MKVTALAEISIMPVVALRPFHGSVGSQQSIPDRLLLLLSHFSRVRLCATPWTAAYQAPPSMGFSRRDYWSGLPLPSPSIDEAEVIQ